jgi:hypothetical protein
MIHLEFFLPSPSSMVEVKKSPEPLAAADGDGGENVDPQVQADTNINPVRSR